jgi:MFS family permease
MFVFSIAMLIAFLFIETKVDDPIIPLSLFHSSIFNYSAIEIFLMAAIMMGASIFIPLFVQGVVGKSASQSGAILTPLMLSMVVGAILSGFIISKTHRYKYQAIVGFAIMGIGALMLASMGVKTENSTVIINMIVMGFGLGIVMPIFNVTAQNSVTENQMGVATSSNQFFKYMGQTISGSVLGTVLTSSMTNGLKNMNTGNLPSNVATILKDPNTLSNSEALKTIMAKLPQTLLPEFIKVIDKMKQILSGSIHQVFIICIVLAAIGIVSMIFMKEIPLAKVSNEKSKNV